MHPSWQSDSKAANQSIETTNVGLYKLKISARRGAEVIERKKGIYSKRDYN
jgi:hypothetical protein